MIHAGIRTGRCGFETIATLECTAESYRRKSILRLVRMSGETMEKAGKRNANIVRSPLQSGGSIIAGKLFLSASAGPADAASTASHPIPLA
jgi:hypothetical protein